jgi:hypothetical protein
MDATREKPTVVMIVVSLEDSSESQTRYISGKTVGEVVSELFGEKEVKAKKPRAKRQSKGPKALGDTSRAEEEQKERAGVTGEGEAPAADAAPEPEAKPRSRKIFA